jgi:hypothetical protein
MTERPKHGGWRALIAAKVVCCGGLVLFATGVLTVNGIGTWLLGGGAIWLVLGGFAVTLLILWRRHGTRGIPSNGRADAVDTERAQ